MIRNITTTILLSAMAWAGCAMGADAAAIEAEAEAPAAVRIVGHDGQTFVCVTESEEDIGAVTCRRLNMPSPLPGPYPENNVIPVEYYFPSNMTEERRPAVVILHILGGDFSLERFFALALARKGIPTAWFYLPYYETRFPAAIAKAGGTLSPRQYLDGIRQGLEETRRVVDFLAAQPGVDPERIGLLGTSMGALLGVAALEREPRIHAAALLLGGANLAKIIGHSRETRQLRKQLDALPPDERAAFDAELAKLEPAGHAEALARLAAEGRVFLAFAAEDEVIAPERADELLRALGLDWNDPLVMRVPGVGHYTALLRLDEPLARIFALFDADGAPTPAKAPSGLWEDVRKALAAVLDPVLNEAGQGRMTVLEADDGAGTALCVRRGPGDYVCLSVEGPALPSCGFGLDAGGLWIRASMLPGTVVRLGGQDDGAAPAAAWRRFMDSGAGAMVAAPLVLARILTETPELAWIWCDMAEGEAAREGERRIDCRIAAVDEIAASFFLDAEGRLAALEIPLNGQVYRARVRRAEEVPFDGNAFSPPGDEAVIRMNADSLGALLTTALKKMGVP